jgi:hypothetical protein
MKAKPNTIMLFRLAGMLVVCIAVPPLLYHYAGAAVGALGATGAALLWYSQYRFPAWEDRSSPSFWFAAGGYGPIGLTLLVCLGQLLG